MKRVGGIVLLVLISAGCAGVTVSRVASEADYREGVRFYRPQPYLLVTDAKGAIETSIIYLPKMNEEYTFQVRPGLNGVDAKATFDDGWNLTSVGDSRTNGTAEILTAVGGLGRAVASFHGLAAPDGGELSPGLYAIEFDPKTGLATGLKHVELKMTGSN